MGTLVVVVPPRWWVPLGNWRKGVPTSVTACSSPVQRRSFIRTNQKLHEELSEFVLDGVSELSGTVATRALS